MAAVRSTLSRRTAVLVSAVLAAAGTAAVVPPDAVAAPPAAVAGDDALVPYDARTGGTAAESSAAQTKREQAQVSAAAVALRTSLGAQGLVDMDSLTGTPRQIARLDGSLTGPSTAAATDVARSYLAAHQDLFRLSAAEVAGLSLARDYVDVDGTHHVSFRQVAGGVPLFGNGVKADVAKDGRLVQVTGSPVPGLTATAVPESAKVGSGPAAIRVARADTREASTDPGPADTATRVLFRTPTGTRAAWQTVTMSARTPALEVVDAATGGVLYRDPLADDYAPPGADTAPAAAAGDRSAAVFANYPSAPKGGRATVVDLTAAGWLPADATTLTGNNSHTYTDVNSNNVADGFEEIGPNTGTGGYRFPLVTFSPAGQNCSTAYPCTWDASTASSWQQNASRTATQNFYFVNRFHDHLQAAPIGFTEAAGNFQTVNGSGAGRGGDAVLTEPLDGANTNNTGGLPDVYHQNNANFATPPDGQAPRMQMYLWGPPDFVSANGSDEADIVYHEYTHGLSHRLVVDAGNVPALDSRQGASMGEAWSDWYAMDYLVDDGYVVDRKTTPGEVALARYVGAGEPSAIRTEPIDCPVGSTAAACPGSPTAGPGGYTYGDFGKVVAGPEVHADGEIWGQTLWDVRSALGSEVSENLVTRGMELSPTYPSMLDMRNAILLADSTVYGGAHTAALWKAFAARGMGYFAGTVDGNDTTPVEDFSRPPAAGSPTGTLAGTVRDSVTKAVLGGVLVAVGGHDSGLPGASFTATTAADGTFSIPGLYAGTYPDVHATKAGYDLAVRAPVRIRGNATTTVAWPLVRDWASSSGGASVASFTGVDYTSYGCGPGNVLDQSPATGWVSRSDLSGTTPTSATPKNVVVALPRAVDVTGVSIDPTSTCGQGISASTGDYRVEVSTDGTTFATVATGTFGVDDLYRLNPVTLGGSGARVVAVRVWMLAPQLVSRGLGCPGNAGCSWLDMTDVEVYGRPSATP